MLDNLRTRVAGSPRKLQQLFKKKYVWLYVHGFIGKNWDDWQVYYKGGTRSETENAMAEEILEWMMFLYEGVYDDAHYYLHPDDDEWVRQNNLLFSLWMKFGEPDQEIKDGYKEFFKKEKEILSGNK